MSNYSAAVARKMGLNNRTVEAILHAAPMHDIGKIGILDKILLKPGKLDAAEWEIMRQHTVIGGKILEGSGSGVIRLGEVIALTHHEKWDGTGYPHRLSGTRIPLVGRIVAVADVFDALTSRRPYKEPFPLDRAYTILREGRGAHFDPAVVDAFFEAEPRNTGHQGNVWGRRPERLRGDDGAAPGERRTPVGDHREPARVRRDFHSNFRGLYECVRACFDSVRARHVHSGRCPATSYIKFRFRLTAMAAAKWYTGSQPWH